MHSQSSYFDPIIRMETNCGDQNEPMVSYFIVFVGSICRFYSKLKRWMLVLEAEVITMVDLAWAGEGFGWRRDMASKLEMDQTES